MSVSIEFQKRMKELISELEYGTSREVAERMGITYVIYSKAVNYAIIPKPIVLIRIADFFDISLEYLLGRTGDDYFDKAKTPKTFTDRLEELRTAEKLTHYELSKKINFSRNYFSNWKKRNFLPSLENLISIAEYFKVSIDYLLGRTDDQ